ncbi:MAG TPA: DUF5719 family protein [Acidimicrobiales bacterium]|jgi:hypothetical protein
MSDAVRRAVLLIVVIAVIVGVALADAGRGPGSQAAGGRSGSGGPAASADGVGRLDAESSAWFCAGGTGAGGNGHATLVLTNPTPRAVTGTVTTTAAGADGAAAGGTGAGGEPSITVKVPRYTQTAVDPAPGAGGAALASTVAFDGGGAGVSQVVTGPLGASAAPCASRTAGSWYFADGSTAGNSTLSLSLFNPGRTTAVVDVSFVTATNGLLAPPAYQGVDVPGGALVAENVGDHVRNAADVATVVTSLSGTVVAAELESAGQAGNGGPSVLLGAPAPSPTWSFGQNMNVAGADTEFHLFNPSGERAQVTVTIGLQQGAAEPLTLSVPAMSAFLLDAARVTRIPADTAFSATFSSRRGPGIVVSRSLSSVAGSPAPQLGEVAGVPGGSDRWLLPATSSPATTSPATNVSDLAVVDLSGADVSVRLAAISATGPVPVAGFGQRRLRPGMPLIVRPGSVTSAGVIPFIGGEPLELVASGPVAVEADIAPAGNAGVVVLPVLPQ